MSETVLQSAGQIAFMLSFQLSPIIFVNGIANALGGLLPIITITESISLVGDLLGGSISTDINQFFAHFRPMPGSTFYAADFSKRPFASMVVASDAVIQQPTRLSMMMTCPVNTSGGYTAKLASMTALIALIYQHVAQGGYFAVMTPAQIFPTMLLEDIVDASGDDIQAQMQFQWNFTAPQLTLQQAQAAQSSQMSKITQGLPFGGSLSGIAQGIGAPFSGVASSIISPAANTLGMNTPTFTAPVIPVTSSPLPPT